MDQNKNYTVLFDSVPRVKEVCVDGEIFIIHCYRYAAKSDFFKVLCYQNFEEKNTKRVEIHGINADIFEKITKLFNTGALQCTHNDAFEMYFTCRYLLVKEVYLEELKSYIVEHLEHLDIFAIFEFCHANADPLLDVIRSYIVPRIELLYDSESYKKTLSLKAILELITDKRLVISEEDMICVIIAAWLASDYSRKIHVGDILHHLIPSTFREGNTINLELSEDNWNLDAIADDVYYWVFEYKPRIARPMVKCEFFNPEDPLYVSREENLLVMTHFEGTLWSILDEPRTPFETPGSISAAARYRSDLFVASWDTIGFGEIETHITKYSFDSQTIVEMKQPFMKDQIEGLHLLNQKLYLNTRNVVSQYCGEHDLWVKPMNIGFRNYSFCASDSTDLYTCGFYDGTGTESVHRFDPRSPEGWWYTADLPDNELGTCGTIIDDDLYMVSLRRNVHEWNIYKLDFRNLKWTLVTSHWNRNSGVPVSIQKCRKKLVVMDHYHCTYVVQNKPNGSFRLFDFYDCALKPVCSYD